MFEIRFEMKISLLFFSIFFVLRLTCVELTTQNLEEAMKQMHDDTDDSIGDYDCDNSDEEVLLNDPIKQCMGVNVGDYVGNWQRYLDSLGRNSPAIELPNNIWKSFQSQNNLSQN